MDRDWKKTANRTQIEDRFKTLGIKIDLSNLKYLSDARNEIEHYFAKETKDIMGIAIMKAFPIMRNVIEELQEEPANLLGRECWDSILADTKFYQEELSRSKGSFAKVRWESEVLCKAYKESDFACTECGSPLLRQKNPRNEDEEDIVFICSHCGEEPERGDVIEAAVGEVLLGETYLAMTDGGEDPVSDCPECGQHTYITDENRCANCGFSMEYQTCAICGEPLGLEDYENGTGLCSYHAYVAERERDK